jgi:hypothetical protein
MTTYVVTMRIGTPAEHNAVIAEDYTLDDGWFVFRNELGSEVARYAADSVVSVAEQDASAGPSIG